MIPGEYVLLDGIIKINVGLPTVTVTVTNTSDRLISVGSHYHFYQTNMGLSFDRDQARGYRLDIASGDVVGFEPGQEREVRLVRFAGR